MTSGYSCAGKRYGPEFFIKGAGADKRAASEEYQKIYEWVMKSVYKDPEYAASGGPKGVGYVWGLAPELVGGDGLNELSPFAKKSRFVVCFKSRGYKGEHGFVRQDDSQYECDCAVRNHRP